MPPHTGAIRSRGQTDDLPLLHPPKKTQVDAASQFSFLSLPSRRVTVRSASSAFKSTGIDPYTGTHYNSGHCDVCGSREISTDTLLQQGNIFPALTSSPSLLHPISSSLASLPSPSTAASAPQRRPRTRPMVSAQSTQRALHPATYCTTAPSSTLLTPSTVPAGAAPILTAASHIDATRASHCTPRVTAAETDKGLQSTCSSQGSTTRMMPPSARRQVSISKGPRARVRTDTAGAHSSAGAGIGTAASIGTARVRKGEVYRGGLAPAVLLEQRYLLADTEKHRIATFIAQAAQLSPLVHGNTALLNPHTAAAARAMPMASGGSAATVCASAPHAALSQPSSITEVGQQDVCAHGSSVDAPSTTTCVSMSETVDARPAEAALATELATESTDYSHALPALPPPTTFSSTSSSAYLTPRASIQLATRSAAPTPTCTPANTIHCVSTSAASLTSAPASATSSAASTTSALHLAPPACSLAVLQPSPQPHPALVATTHRQHTSAAAHTVTLGSLSNPVVARNGSRTHTSAHAQTSPAARNTISRLSTMHTPCSLTVVSVRRPKRPTPPLYAAARPPCTGASARVSRAWAGMHLLLHEDDEAEDGEEGEEREEEAAPEYGCEPAYGGAMPSADASQVTPAVASGGTAASLTPLQPAPSLAPEQPSVADLSADTTRLSTHASTVIGATSPLSTSLVSRVQSPPATQTAAAGLRASASELHAVDTGLFVGHAVKLHPLKQRIYASVPYLLQRALARRAAAEVIMARICSPTSSYNRVRVRGHRPISHAEPFEALAYNVPPPVLPVAPVSELSSHRGVAKLAREQRRLSRVEKAMGRVTARRNGGKRAKSSGAGGADGASGGTGAVKGGSTSKRSPRPHTTTSTSSSSASTRKIVRFHRSASSTARSTSASTAAPTSVSAAVRDPWQQTAKRLRDSLYRGDYRMNARLERLARPPQALALIRLVGSDLNLPYHMLKQAEEHTELGDFTASGSSATKRTAGVGGRNGLYGIEDVTADVIHRFGGHGRPQTVLANTGISDSLEMRPSTESHFNHLQCGTARTQPIIRANLIANKPVMSAAMALQNTLCTCPPPSDDCLPGPCECGSLQGACVEALLSARSLDEVDESVGLYHSFL